MEILSQALPMEERLAKLENDLSTALADRDFWRESSNFWQREAIERVKREDEDFRLGVTLAKPMMASDIIADAAKAIPITGALPGFLSSLNIKPNKEDK